MAPAPCAMPACQLACQVPPPSSVASVGAHALSSGGHFGATDTQSPEISGHSSPAGGSQPGGSERRRGSLPRHARRSGGMLSPECGPDAPPRARTPTVRLVGTVPHDSTAPYDAAAPTTPPPTRRRPPPSRRHPSRRACRCQASRRCCRCRRRPCLRVPELPAHPPPVSSWTRASGLVARPPRWRPGYVWPPPRFVCYATTSLLWPGSACRWAVPVVPASRLDLPPSPCLPRQPPSSDWFSHDLSPVVLVVCPVLSPSQHPALTRHLLLRGHSTFSLMLTTRSYPTRWAPAAPL